MIIKVRTIPIDVFYLTGDDAAEAREVAGDDSSGPCFVTESFGYDGFIWKTAEDFESDYAVGPGSDDPAFEKFRLS